MVDAERLERRVDRPALPAGALGRQLRRDEDLGAVDAAVPQRTADLRLVAVHRGGVDVAVAGVQRHAYGVIALGALGLPGAEAEERHGPAATGQWDAR
jgi:hypothetical protein